MERDREKRTKHNAETKLNPHSGTRWPTPEVTTTTCGQRDSNRSCFCIAVPLMMAAQRRRVWAASCLRARQFHTLTRRNGLTATGRKAEATNANNHLLHTLYTCTPSSLVATTMIANAHVSGGTPSNPALPASASALCITGTAYASVLPLPVSALVTPRHRVGVGTGVVGAGFRNHFGFVFLAFFEGGSLRRICNSIAAVAYRRIANLAGPGLPLPCSSSCSPPSSSFCFLTLRGSTNPPSSSSRCRAAAASAAAAAAACL
jgi:hypothetical protein